MRKTLLSATIALLALAGSATAADVEVPAKTSSPYWFDTGVSLPEGKWLDITATGSWSGGPGDWHGPEGFGPAPSEFLVPGAPAGGLVGRIESGDGFGVGAGTRIEASARGAGKLWLAFNDHKSQDAYADNDGSVNVSVTIGGPKPTVTTQPATNLGQTSATLNGQVASDGGEGCQYRFRYMKSGGAYSYTTWTGSVTTGQSFSESLSGLTASSTYYFNAQAKNSGGESDWGNEQSFTTSEVITAPTVTTQAATGISTTSATLNGAISSDGGQACQYQFRYKKSGGSYTTTAWTGSVTTGQPFSQAISGLDSGSTYYFNAKAKNSVGESDWGSEQSFTTGTSVSVPSVASQSAVNVGQTSATLRGSITSDGGQTCQYRFRYKRSGGAYSYTSWTGSVTTGSSFSESISGLTPSSTYYFNAQARNSVGESSWGTELSFTTLSAPPVIVTPTVSVLSASNVGQTTATLRAQVNDDGGEACQYRLRYRISGAIYTYTSWTGSVTTGQPFSESVSGLMSGFTYYFSAQARNSAGEGGWGSELSFTATSALPSIAVPSVSALAAGSVGPTTATLRGQINSDGGEQCAYRFRYKKSGGSYIYTTWTGFVTAGRSLNEFLSTLTTGSTYYFNAQAKNSAGESSWSNEVSFTTTGGVGGGASGGPGGKLPSPAYSFGKQEKAQGFTKDPVNTATGNFIHEEMDLALPPARGKPLSFARFYNSLDQETPSALGPGWWHSYQIRLTTHSSGTLSGLVSVKWADGRTDYWKDRFGLGLCEPQTAGLYDRLYKTAGMTWTVTTKALDTYNFDSLGRLSRIVDKNGNTTSFEHKEPRGNWLVSAVVDSSGRTLSFTYSGSLLLATVSDNGDPARIVRYSYTNGRLTQVRDVLGNTIKYGYDGNGYLATITDQRGVVTVTNMYHSDGRVMEQRDANGNKTKLAYDTPAANQTTITDAKGNTTIHTHVTGYKLLYSVTNPLGQSIFYCYDENANRVSITDRNGHTINFKYDSRGNVTQKTDPNDPDDPSDGGTTTVKYENAAFPDLPTERVDAFGHVTRWEYDDKGNVAGQIHPNGMERKWTYNSFGQKLTETAENGGTTKFAYDPNGLLTEIVDPTDRHVWFGYDELWRLTRVTDGRGAFAGDPNHTISTSYDKADRATAVTGPLTSTRFEYDQVGHTTKAVNGRGFETLYTHDKNGNMTKVERMIPDHASYVVQYEYDALDRKVKTIDANGNATTLEYDAAGRLVQQTNADGDPTQYTYDPHGNLLSATDASGVSISFVYDALNRRARQEDGIGNHWSWEYDRLGQLIVQTDANGHGTQYAYDSLGRLVSVTDPAGQTTRYKYDAVGNLIQVTDAAGKVTARKSYDLANRLTRKEDGLGHAYQYAHGQAGNLASELSPNGHTRTFEYDNENRLVGIGYPDSTRVLYSYDANGNLVQMTDPTGVTTHTYDELDRLASSTDSFGKTVNYGYDLVGNRTSITYPADSRNPERTVVYDYDRANRLEKIIDWVGRTWAIKTDPAGRMTQMSYPNGIAKSIAYDSAGRLLSLSYQHSDRTALMSYEYTRDPQENPTGIAERGTLKAAGLPSLDNQYAYNENNWLLSSSAEPISYSYDASGNRTSQTAGAVATTFAYDNDNRLLSSTQPAAYTYDNNGNLTARTSAGITTSFTYDFNNQLIAQTTGISTVEHVYDGQGNRVARNDNGSRTHYVLDRGRSMSHVLCETDGSGNITAYYIHGPEIVGRIGSDGSERCYHTDQVGSVTALTDQTQAVTDQYAYTPFGTLIAREGTTPNPFTYIGGLGVTSEPDNLYFMRARFYDPQAGQFLMKDPAIGLSSTAISCSSYNYALNNPLVYLDPGGLAPSQWDILSQLLRPIVGVYLVEANPQAAQILTLTMATKELSTTGQKPDNVKSLAGITFGGGSIAVSGAVTGASTAPLIAFSISTSALAIGFEQIVNLIRTAGKEAIANKQKAESIPKNSQTNLTPDPQTYQKFKSVTPTEMRKDPAQAWEQAGKMSDVNAGLSSPQGVPQLPETNIVNFSDSAKHGPTASGGGLAAF